MLQAQQISAHQRHGLTLQSTAEGILEENKNHHDRVAKPVDDGLTLASDTLPLQMAAHIKVRQKMRSQR